MSLSMVRGAAMHSNAACLRLRVRLRVRVRVRVRCSRVAGLVGAFESKVMRVPQLCGRVAGWFVHG
jgi:hypothetical protein